MDQAVSASVATRTGKANTFAANVLPLIERLQAGGGDTGIGVVAEFQINAGNISGVKHALAVQGCSK
jgi:hypothetical protein